MLLGLTIRDSKDISHTLDSSWILALASQGRRELDNVCVSV